MYTKQHPLWKRLALKGVAACLALSAVAGLTSCGQGEADETSSAESGSAEMVTEAVTAASAYASLPRETFGREFRILTRADIRNDFLVESYGGDKNSLLDDTIYERNRVLEDDYGITFVHKVEDDYAHVLNTVSAQVNGGLDEFDLAIGNKFSFGNCAQNNWLLDLAAIPTIQLDSPWWDAACLKSMTVRGKTYQMTGDILPSSMRMSSCFTFNKQMMTDMGKDMPYQMVRDGAWTLDALLTLTEGVTRDKNGDGNLVYTDDQYGLTAWTYDAPFAMFYGAGGMFVVQDGDGLPELSYDAERVSDIYDKLYQILVAQEAYLVTDVAFYKTNYDVFVEGRALFCEVTLNKVTAFISDMEQDYGILPEPKYDTEQKEYLSFVNGSSGFAMILNTEKNPEFVGTILDAMGAYNYDHVTPNMFEIITKLKTARDPESSEMVDFIIRNRVFDFGYFFDLEITNVVQAQLNAKNQSIASALRRADRNSGVALKKIIAAFEKCN